jgi:SAM-dependent methyltransferase
VHQNLVIKDQAVAVNITRGDLKFVCCDECGFVFNSAFDPSKLSYGAAYDNTQTCSPYFRDYVEAMVRYLVYEKGVRNCRIVEVGCGRGYFLRRLVEEDVGNTGYGFDPAYVGPEIELDGRLKFERRFYGLDCVDIPADVVICRHVVEHVQDPIALLRLIRQALRTSPNARVFFETPSLEWILRNQVIWDFFYEHCSLFSGNSLATLFETTGFKVESVRHVFGGQYLWVEAMMAEDDTPVVKGPGNIPQLARQFGLWETALRDTWKQKVQQVAAQRSREREKIAIWGAGAKGVTFANLVDPKRELITCVVDLNPQKQGNYLPGTGHPIVDYRELGDLGVTTAILMNPNYREENQALLRQAGLSVKLVE